MHERFMSLMSLRLDGLATPEEQLELAQHLDGCPECATTWDQWLAMDRLLATAPSVTPSRDLSSEVSQVLYGSVPRVPSAGWLPLGILVWGSGSLAMTCLTLAGLLWWGWRHPLAVAVVLSSGAKVLSGVTSLLAGVETAMGVLSGLGLGGSLAISLIGSCGLITLWVCVVMRAGSSWLHERP